MTVLSPPFALGAAGQVLSGRLLRLSQGAAFRPGAAAVSAVSGCLHGPAGSMGELTLVNPTTVRVNPFVAVIQGTHSTTQGQYSVPNDALVDLTVGGQHATLFRRDLIAVTVADSQAAGVASSGTTDRAYLHVIPGTNAASNPALPAAPANTLLLGEVSVPPVGQTVTLTPYNPRTTLRGGVLPVFDDASTAAGHGGEPGTYTGQYRDHPTRGLQRWTGTAWVGATRAHGLTVAHWAHTTRHATSNENIAQVTLNPQVGPYVAVVRTSGDFNPSAGADGSLRIFASGEVNYIATDRITAAKRSAEVSRFYPVADGAARTFYANLEVLAGSIEHFTDARHSMIEAFALPIA